MTTQAKAMAWINSGRLMEFSLTSGASERLLEAKGLELIVA